MVDVPPNPTKTNHIYLIYTYKEDNKPNNQQAKRFTFVYIRDVLQNENMFFGKSIHSVT